MDELDYQFLLELYEQKSITRVARQQYLTQSALTKRIQHVEDELGCQLIIRSKQGVAFTPAGESVIDSCRKIVQEQESMRDALNRIQGIVGGTLHIGCSANFCRYRMPEVLLQYREQYPNVDVKIETGHSDDLYNMLLENKLSIAIIRGDHVWEDGSILLSSEPLCLVRARDKRDCDLADYTYIGHHTDVKEEKLIARWIRENNIPTGRELWINDIGSCKRMAEVGIGWSILPSICLDQFDGDVIPLQLKDGTPLVRNTYVLYRPACIELLQVSKFIELLTKNVSELESPKNI